MKIQHIYTVVREFNIEPEEFKEEKEFFNGAMQDEPGEFLYGGSASEEKITIKMKVKK